MKKFILAIDQGTTSTRAILFNKEGKPCFKAQTEVKCTFPKSGWVEADALSIWLSTLDVISEVMVRANASFDEVDSIGITNQRETTVVWDNETGMPIYNAIIWQSRQSAYVCDQLDDKKDIIFKKTGLNLNPYFSATKIRFILDNVEGAQQKAEEGKLSFGTIDTWLIYKLTNKIVFATDITNASRTLLFNINTKTWDDELLSLFNIPKCMLPKICPCSCDYGTAKALGSDIHIYGVAGDQQAALFGQTCFEKGDCKNTYGTGCFMLMNIGDKPLLSKNGLITTVAWELNGKTTYALEGSVFMGGAVIQWLRDEMKMLSEAKESEELANKCNVSHGIYVVPAFVGLGAPYWDDDARGAIFGLTRGTDKNHFVRATLESIAYECKDVFETMKSEIGGDIVSLKVDGGATANNYLMQFQSNILPCKIQMPECLETTALGAAYFAGLGSGFYKDLNEIKQIHKIQKDFSPSMNMDEVDKLYKGWKKAVEATRVFKL